MVGILNPLIIILLLVNVKLKGSKIKPKVRQSPSLSVFYFTFHNYFKLFLSYFGMKKKTY